MSTLQQDANNLFRSGLALIANAARSLPLEVHVSLTVGRSASGTADVQRPASLPDGAADLSTSHRAVLVAITRGVDRPKDIQEATGKSQRRVQELLKDLLDRKFITKDDTNYGRYQVA